MRLYVIFSFNKAIAEEVVSRSNYFDSRALCQKNEGSVEAKQRSIKMGDRTIYRTLSS
jgi:hypothetical protein